MSQTVSVSETQTLKSELNINEILDDLLYRSSKPNPNREILIAPTVSQKNGTVNGKSQCRQRQPARLLPATIENGVHSSSSVQRHSHNGNSIPVVLSRQNSANYWNQYPSESEFDTTRIDNYLNALNLSRRHRSQKPVNRITAKPMRSRSVDATLTRLKLSIHKPVNTILNAFTSPTGAKSASTQSGSAKSQSSRNALVTRSESLNSEGSSLSGESLCFEFNSNHNTPGKSVLKKNSAGNAVHIGPGKKNVTFSAFATIQLMEG